MLLPMRAVAAVCALAAGAWAQPTISSLSPEATTAGSGALTMTIRGSGFGNGVSVRFGARSLPVVILSSTTLQVQLGAELLRTEGLVEVRVDLPGLVASSNALIFLLRPPIQFITPPALMAAASGQLFLQAISVTGGSPPYRFDVAGGSPPVGLSLNPATGALAGFPSGDGNYTFTIAVTDAASVQSLRTFTMTVVRPISISGPTILPAAIVSHAFQTQLAAAGGLLPYRWSIVNGTPPAGITMSATGLLGGFPSAAGSFEFSIQVTDSAGLTAVTKLSLTVRTALVILAVGQWQDSLVGSGFQQTLAAAGGLPPYQWRLPSGSLPPGVSLDPNTGILYGLLAAVGTFRFTVQVGDAGGQTAAIELTLTAIARLAITTEASLPAATLGADYSARLAATGGSTPYRWTVSAVPAGLGFDAATSTLQGRPTVAGFFRIPVAVVDAGGLKSERQFVLDIGLPRAPGLILSGMTGGISPAKQYLLQAQIAEPYPAQIDGVITMEFAPAPGLPDDLAVQFSNGTRSISFRIPAGATDVVFPVPLIAVQSGTVAGTIHLATRTVAQGLLLDPQPAVEIWQMQAQIPVLDAVLFLRTPAGFDVRVTGFSNTRDLTKATFRFQPAPGADLRTVEIEIPLQALAANWFAGAESDRFGGMFSYQQSFLLQGDASAASAVTVELGNGIGNSQRLTATAGR